MNVAARVEGLSKDIGAVIVATSECIAACGGQVHAEDKGLYSVKGRSEAVRIYVVHGLNEQA